jgi:hypothetical protein
VTIADQQSVANVALVTYVAVTKCDVQSAGHAEHHQLYIEPARALAPEID